MRFKAIIFDLDGTLLDTIDDIAHSMNTVLDRLGYPTHPVDSYRYFVGNGVEKLVRQALPQDCIDDEMVRRCVSAMLKEYERRWADNSKPFKGIPELLTWVEKHRIPKAILSNKPDDFTQVMVKRLLSHWSFDIVQGAKPSIPRKPDPTAALAIAYKLGVKPEQVLFLGDTNVDMKTANSAGMYAAGVLWGFRPAEELLESGARALVREPKDVLKIILAGDAEAV